MRWRGSNRHQINKAANKQPSHLHVGRFNAISLLLPVQVLETIHLIPLQVIDAIGAALEPADDDGPFRQVDVVPAQIASL
jgi:hypothetical protein